LYENHNIIISIFYKFYKIYKILNQDTKNKILDLSFNASFLNYDSNSFISERLKRKLIIKKLSNNLDQNFDFFLLNYYHNNNLTFNPSMFTHQRNFEKYINIKHNNFIDFYNFYNLKINNDNKLLNTLFKKWHHINNLKKEKYNDFFLKETNNIISSKNQISQNKFDYLFSLENNFSNFEKLLSNKINIFKYKNNFIFEESYKSYFEFIIIDYKQILKKK
jgi:hypothetical protein